jgi:hypothetical protein
MPWRQVDPMTERLSFIRDARQRVATFTDLCQLYEISRTTGYKWLHRAEQSGVDYLRSSPAGRTRARMRRHPNSLHGSSRRGAIIPAGARASFSSCCAVRTGARGALPGGPLGVPWPRCCAATGSPRRADVGTTPGTRAGR